MKTEIAKTEIKMKDLPAAERPRERLLKYGAEALSDAELLAIILGTGTKGMNVITVCRHVFRDMSLKKLSRSTAAELMKIPGIGQSKSCQIISIFELSRRLEAYSDEPKRKINEPDDIFRYIYPKIREEKQEKVIILCLDTKNQVISDVTVFVGGLDISIFQPREIFKSALLESAASIVLIHNHPSGDPTPSREDIIMTNRIIDSGKLLGIHVWDHLIIGDGRFISLKEEEYI
ncbi:MAG: DNA repair protein RadC [Methanosarcinales archaeon]|jgi:DNA repair protein RadC|nr:DNA repair protein RadC [Methanosarcinales archaeon]